MNIVRANFCDIGFIWYFSYGHLWFIIATERLNQSHLPRKLKIPQIDTLKEHYEKETTKPHRLEKILVNYWMDGLEHNTC